MQRVHFLVRVGVFNSQQILRKISFVIFDIVVRKKTNRMSFSVALVKFHRFYAVIFRFIIQKTAPQAESGKYFQIWFFFPRFRGEKWRRPEHAHASYPGLSFRPSWFSPYKGREERRVPGLG